MDQPILFEYTSAAVPIIDELKPTFLSYDENNFIQTPSLLIQYIHISQGKRINQNLRNATSHVFYVLDGEGTTIYLNGEIHWKQGDVFTLPSYNLHAIHRCSEDSILFYANDSPLLNFLHVNPSKPRFLPTHYKCDIMLKQIEDFNNEEDAKIRNRNGILLSNKRMVEEKLNTLTHTMWSLLNSISPDTVQKPHKHNSIAVDLCIYANDEEEGKVYTIMGKEIDEKGNILNPVKMIWKSGCTFTTPPGWWHSHHNESSEIAWVFPVQDAGLHTYLRTLDIQFQK